MVNHLRHIKGQKEGLKAVRKEWGAMVREAKVPHGHTRVRKMRQKAMREEWAAMVTEVEVLKGVCLGMQL
jgi:imidazoleglycerol phosphate synthase glutamine amidotransferase subunit HisH